MHTLQVFKAISYSKTVKKCFLNWATTDNAIEIRLSHFATGKVEQKQPLWEITKNADKNLWTEASSQRIRAVCVDLGTAEGKYGLYTEDTDDCRGGSLATSSPAEKQNKPGSFFFWGGESKLVIFR